MTAPQIFTPTRFDELAAVADCFLGGTMVVLNLRAADEAERRRITDFAAGMVYATGGEMERLASGFLALRPLHHRVRSAGAA